MCARDPGRDLGSAGQYAQLQTTSEEMLQNYRIQNVIELQGYKNGTDDSGQTYLLTYVGAIIINNSQT